MCLSHLYAHPARKEGWGAQRPVINLEQSMKNELIDPLLFPRHTMTPAELRDHILSTPGTYSDTLKNVPSLSVRMDKSQLTVINDLFLIL